jgi:hypothetical protein
VENCKLKLVGKWVAENVILEGKGEGRGEGGKKDAEEQRWMDWKS